MARIDTSIEIERPPEDVFAYLTDLRNAGEWSTELVDVMYDGDLRTGTTGADTRRMGRREIVMPWTITAFDPPTRMVIEYRGPFPATAEFSFRPTAAGTVVACATELRPRGLWKLLGPVIAREGKRSDQVQFQNVKRILEAREPQSHIASHERTR